MDNHHQQVGNINTVVIKINISEPHNAHILTSKTYIKNHETK